MGQNIFAASVAKKMNLMLETQYDVKPAVTEFYQRKEKED